MRLLVNAAVAACFYTAMSAGAADMRVVPVKASPVATASWTGFYLGLDAGTQSSRASGAAWPHYEVASACPGLCALPMFSLSPAVSTSSATKAGWTIGGGVESLWWGGWLARAEYRYADFGTESFTLTRTGGGLITSVVDNFDVKIRTHTAAIGLAYKFAD